ncbi:NAD(P)-dependent oxidoreductase [Mesorhizobium abyssinicae]|uniref:NAD(P)-dependent oxidoreductase n=1 Tax=Mesorhizobium abyssinicae TaxID=1209958 RepID=UPI0033913065
MRETKAVTLLGMGAMGKALALAAIEKGWRTTVWNRSPERLRGLTERGAQVCGTLEEAVSSNDLVVICLHNYASVAETVASVSANAIRGKQIVNLTTHTPDEAQALHEWALDLGITYVQGAILATPAMIGKSDTNIIYCGSKQLFDAQIGLFECWSTAIFATEDPRSVPYLDLALQSTMYSLFTGFLHGAAMVQAAGMKAADFANLAHPFMCAMSRSFHNRAMVVDTGEFSKSSKMLAFTGTILDIIVDGCIALNVDPQPMTEIRSRIDAQVEQGYGDEGFDRLIKTYQTRP